MDAESCNIFTAICPRNKKAGDSFEVTDPTGTRMKVIIPHGIKPGQRFSIRGRGSSRRKSGHSKDSVPAFAVHKESCNMGALTAKSKTSFSWRFIYAKPDERDREHSLYVKYSRNSRNLRVWFDGANKIDTNIPDRMCAVHRLDMSHKSHKLGVKLLMNEDGVEADFEIDGFEFEKLPQPDQLMSRQVCIPMAIALRHAVEDVGKIVTSSKQRYTWEYKVPGMFGGRRENKLGGEKALATGQIVSLDIPLCSLSLSLSLPHITHSSISQYSPRRYEQIELHYDDVEWFENQSLQKRCTDFYEISLLVLSWWYRI